MRIHNQPIDGNLVDIINSYLKSPSYLELNIFVAFAKTSGLTLISNDLLAFKKKGGKISVFVGIDLDGTSYEALCQLLTVVTELYVVHAESPDITYHPKIFDFIGSKQNVVILGSNNLTKGGLCSNYESSLIIEENTAEIQKEIEKFLRILKGSDVCRRIRSIHDIDELLKYCYIKKEKQIHAIKAATLRTRGKADKKLFGSGLRNPTNKPNVFPGRPTGNQGNSGLMGDFITSNNFSSPRQIQTLWIESKAMTGGSRNILDLSKEAKLISGNPAGTSYSTSNAKFIKGPIYFFGGETSTKETKNITLVYDGLSFRTNTILFPSGQKANGTWRLQIKGTTENGEKITEYLTKKFKKDYLQRKILMFTRLDEDVYEFSILEPSELKQLSQKSTLVALNGNSSQSKTFGYY